MKYLKWVAIIFLAGLLGVLFVQFLSVHPLQMSVYLFATCLVLFLLIVLLAVGFRRRAPKVRGNASKTVLDLLMHIL